MYIEGASYRCLNAPQPCTDEDGLLLCSATVVNLSERGEPDIITLVRQWDILRALRTGESTQGSILSMNPDCMGTARSGIEPGTFGVLNERRPARPIQSSSIPPAMSSISLYINQLVLKMDVVNRLHHIIIIGLLPHRVTHTHSHLSHQDVCT